jgi:hypothetical protein
MNQNRKSTIIQEIQFWKQNNMLPEHYCDYLLALYTEGDNIASDSADKSKKSKNTTIHPIVYIFILLLSLISLFVIYFTELSIVLQTAILASFVVFLLLAGFYYSKKQISPVIIYLISAFILLILSIEIAEFIFEGQALYIYLSIVLNCFLWMFIGRKLKKIYFTISGILGLITIFVFILL